MVTTGRDILEGTERWQRGDKAGDMEEESLALPRPSNAKTEKGRGAEPRSPWWSTGQEPLEAGR